MNDNPALPQSQTKSYRLLTLTALSGEFPTTQANRIGGTSYMEAVAKALKRDGLLRTYYKDKHRGYRLTAKAKALLLAENPHRYRFYLTGTSETNQPKSELTRRLRLHRIAESLVTMQNAGILIHRDEKPQLFYPNGLGNDTITHITEPCFYSSREMKELGVELIKIRGGRAVGILLAATCVFVVYNTAEAMMKWEYKSEMRTKALMKTVLCRERMSHQYRLEQVRVLLLGSSMDMALELLNSSLAARHNYFIFDGNYDHFPYIPNTRAGEVLLQLLCDAEKTAQLNQMLCCNLSPRDTGNVMENDGLDASGAPVLLAYDFDLLRIARFHHAAQLHGKKGTIICFDFQADVLRAYCCAQIKLETISLQKFEGRFFNQT